MPKSPSDQGTPAKPRAGRRTQVRRSGVHGRGVYAVQDFAPGDFILEYLGERISWPEAERRHDEKTGDPFHTFFFQTEQGDVIDGGVRGNSARWINHSCEPNCEAQEDDDGRIFIVALLPIAAGTELFYDYALEIDERLTPALKRDYQCLCGTPTCRGTMLKTRRKRTNSKAALTETKVGAKAEAKAKAETTSKAKAKPKAKTKTTSTTTA